VPLQHYNRTAKKTQARAVKAVKAGLNRLIPNHQNLGHCNIIRCPVPKKSEFWDRKVTVSCEKIREVNVRSF